MYSSVKHIFIVIFISVSSFSFSQTIQGTLVAMPNSLLKMDVFDGVNTITVEQKYTDEKGFFYFNYSNYKNSLCLLKSNDEALFAIILNGENITLTGLSLLQPESITITQGDINLLFDRYKHEIVVMEQAYDAWMYLNLLYRDNNLASTNLLIADEISRIEKQKARFISDLPQDCYLKWYLQRKKMITDVGIAVRYQNEKVYQLVDSLRSLNYADEKLYRSGLLKDLLESHFWLLMTNSNSIDSMHKEMKVSIDVLLERSFTNEKMYNSIANYLFEMFEHKNLAVLNEYLSFKLQSKQGCAISDQLNANLSKYSNVKTGSIAPEIIFENRQNFALNNNTNYPQKLSEIKSLYTLVVFGASWCPHCQKELPELAQLNSVLTKKNIQVVLISLDEDSVSFNNFAKNFPFISYCDYAKWNSKIVHDYSVFSTPAFFLLNNEKKILLKPNSILHLKELIEKNGF